MYTPARRRVRSKVLDVQLGVQIRVLAERRCEPRLRALEQGEHQEHPISTDTKVIMHAGFSGAEGRERDEERVGGVPVGTVQRSEAPSLVKSKFGFV